MPLSSNNTKANQFIRLSRNGEAYKNITGGLPTGQNQLLQTLLLGNAKVVHAIIGKVDIQLTLGRHCIASGTQPQRTHGSTEQGVIIGLIIGPIIRPFRTIIPIGRLAKEAEDVIRRCNTGLNLGTQIIRMRFLGFPQYRKACSLGTKHLPYPHPPPALKETR